MRARIRADRPGIALLVVLLVTMVVAAIAAGAALIGANSFLINEYDDRMSLLETVADAGLELGRARLNANPGLFPDTGYTVLEQNAAALDAAGKAIAGVTRSVYAAPVGGGPGEYGTFGTLVAVAQDENGTKTIRRLDLLQESFAIYAYFTDFEPTNIAFGGNDQLYGPVHSNSDIKIRNTGATFHGPVTTAGVFEGAEWAEFRDDTTSGVTPILMPTPGHIERLRDRATPGHLALTGSTAGAAAQSGMRLEFFSREVGAGNPVGFIRVYRHFDVRYVTGNVPAHADSMLRAHQCGHYHIDDTFNHHVGDNAYQLSALKSKRRRCHLGGADSLWGRFVALDQRLGQWQSYPGTVHPDVQATQPDDAAYLFPLDRRYNPGFRGIIHVEGKVVVSGTVRGRVTLAASGNIIIGDDLRYNTDPGSGTCEDMLGLVSAGQVIVADNMLNSPRRPIAGENYYDYDDSPDGVYIHASILTLEDFSVQNFSSGPTSAMPCNGVSVGRGCLNVTGGLIQRVRGPVGTTLGHGYAKRYTHDTCAFTDPPPYFPSTGHFWRSRYYEADPTGFDVGAYIRALN